MSSSGYLGNPQIDFKEAAILILGTVASEEECLVLLEPHIPVLVPFLM